MADCGWIPQWEGAPKVGALGDIVSVGGNWSDFRCPQGRTASRISFFTWWNSEIRVLIFPRIDAPIVNLNIHFFDHRVGFDRGLTSSYSRAG